jgi:ATP-binding cassette subfamily C protein/ATP-binding cassette subfamily C protein LapB
LNSYSQGAKILFPLLDALNWKGDENRLKEYINGIENSVTTDEIIDIMASLNYKLIELGHKVEDDDLYLPLLVETEDRYLLVLRTDETDALVYDAKKECFLNVTLADLVGNVMYFKYVAELNDSLLHEQKNWFLKLMLRFKNSFSLLIGLTFLTTCLDLLIPLFVMLIYDQIGSSQSTSGLIVLLMGILLYFTSALVIEYYRNMITNYISTRMGGVISKQTFKKLLYLPPSYTETASISAQINRIKDFENLKRFMNSRIFVNTIELVFSVLYVAVIFLIGGWIGIIPLITFVVVLLVDFLLKPIHKSKSEITSNQKASHQHYLIEIVKNADSIKSSGMTKFWLKKSKEISSRSIYSNYDQSKFVSTSNNITYFITNLSVIVLIYGGVMKIFQGHMSMGALIGVVLLNWKVIKAIRLSSSLLVQINGLQRSIKQINKFMKLPQDTTLRANMVLTNEIKGQVQFKDVSIRYNKTSKAALINVNFLLEQGKILGVEGHDGAGKTTILKLILGMYTPQGGRIMIDNWNIKQLEPLTLRRAVSYASERDMIFMGTIRSNFRQVNPSVTDDTINNLVDDTGLRRYMDLYHYELDTLITSDMIDNMSESFLKLFTITRALCRDVNVYLFDEPENHLNHQEIMNIARIIQKLSFNDKTVVVTTKSQSLLAICDQVLKLNQGRGKVSMKGEVYEKEA